MPPRHRYQDDGSGARCKVTVRTARRDQFYPRSGREPSRRVAFFLMVVQSVVGGSPAAPLHRGPGLTMVPGAGLVLVGPQARSTGVGLGDWHERRRHGDGDGADPTDAPTPSLASFPPRASSRPAGLTAAAVPASTSRAMSLAGASALRGNASAHPRLGTRLRQCKLPYHQLWSAVRSAAAMRRNPAKAVNACWWTSASRNPAL